MARTANNDSERLQGVRVIIVEDSFVVAQSLEYLLCSYGCDIVGKASNLESSMALAGTTDFDVAVLDIRLGHELVTGVADRVSERDKHIIFLTGYSDSGMLPDHLQDYPCLRKPVEPQLLVETIAEFGTTSGDPSVY